MLGVNLLQQGATGATAVRVAGGRDAVYLDLGDPSWRVVQVTPSGSLVVTDPPARGAIRISAK